MSTQVEEHELEEHSRERLAALSSAVASSLAVPSAAFVSWAGPSSRAGQWKGQSSWVAGRTLAPVGRTLAPVGRI